MLILILSAAFVLYDGLYLVHCIRLNRYLAAAGTALLMISVTAGTLLLRLNVR